MNWPPMALHQPSSPPLVRRYPRLVSSGAIAIRSSLYVSAALMRAWLAAFELSPKTFGSRSGPLFPRMLVVAPPAALGFVLGRFLQVKFQSIEMANGVEAVPRLAEAEA